MDDIGFNTTLLILFTLFGVLCGVCFYLLDSETRRQIAIALTRADRDQQRNGDE